MKNYIWISSLHLASVLLALGYSIEEIDKSKSKAGFAFKNTKELEKEINKYWKEDLLVPARKLHDARDYLKDRIFRRE